jgi:Zn-dependent membrane protease YugP
MWWNPDYMLWVMLPSVALALFAQWRVRSAMSKWSQVPNERCLTGEETARIIMQQAGLTHIAVERTPGDLTDHYDPRTKTIRLSDTSTRAPSVAAMAIVAHELGHAQQDQTGNALLGVRSALVPVANIGTTLGMWLVVIGYMVGMMELAWAGVGLFTAFVAFTLVTLPVEFDASRRANKFLKEFNLTTARESAGAKAVLDAAALTYVAAAAGALLQLAYYASLVLGRDRD